MNNFLENSSIRLDAPQSFKLGLVDSRETYNLVSWKPRRHITGFMKREKHASFWEQLIFFQKFLLQKSPRKNSSNTSADFPKS